jgi:prepilin-type N-terminal cleavage/methylation domain-containing protein
MKRVPARRTRIPHAESGQRGMTMTEILVGAAIMAVVAGTVAALLGVAVQSKMIGTVRSGDTETARTTLAWMAERLRNAGLNLRPTAQVHPRCRDRVVAQDAGLLPTARSVYVSGEVLKTNPVAAAEVVTVGYYLATDSDTGNQVVMEYKQPCVSGATSLSTYSARLSNPKLNVTGLTFQYYDAGGMEITSLTSSTEIRKIAAIKILLTVQGAEGRSGPQKETLARSVVLWNPEPNTNNWVNPNENY